MSYIINDFLLIVLVIGFVLLASNNLQIDNNQIKKISVLLTMVIGITTLSILEVYYSTFPSPNYGRLICSFLCYSLRPLILITFISLLSNNKIIKYYYSLSIINILIYSTCFYSNVAFSFTASNSFERGPLGYSTHFVCIIYLLLLVYLIIKRHNNKFWNRTIMLMFITIISIIAAIFDNIMATNLFDQTLLICILIYYLFLYMEYNKIDPLTNTFNRTSFYNDIKMHKNSITAILSIDMNNLKYINDNYGHLEGDKALKTMAEIFFKSEKENARFYRIGGDEFAILCFNIDENDVKNIIKRINDNMSKTNYTCSIGYEMNNNYDDIYELYKKADEKMYLEKSKFHKKNKKSR